MTPDFRLTFAHWAYAACLVVALVLGALLATSGTILSALGLSLMFFALTFPILLYWHHAMLICVANAAVIVYFLPGQPGLWMVMAGCSLVITILERAVRKETDFIHVPVVAWAVVFLSLVVAGTAFMTGGIGSRVMGSDNYGGSRYFATFASVFAYFGLVSHRIPPKRGMLLASLFFLGGITAVASDLIYAAGPRFYFLFAFFPTQLAYLQAITQDAFVRSTGLTWTALSVFYFTLLRFGIRGLLDFKRPWRMALFLSALIAAFFGGYRSSVLLMAFVLLAQFFFEGLHRTRILVIFTVIGVIAGPLFIGNLERMPLTVQRSFSFLPVDVDPRARADAAATVDWRVTMWKIMVPEIPKYLWLGKGYSFSGSEFYLTQEAVKDGIVSGYEEALVTGDYHNGVLTLLIPFGVWGMLGFLWLGVGGIWVLWKNWKYGDPLLVRANTFLLSYFVARFGFYLVFYGKFDQDLFTFTGTLGLSIALNHGVRRPEDLLEAEPEVQADAIPEEAPASPVRA
jgi:hypothetical protein